MRRSIWKFNIPPSPRATTRAFELLTWFELVQIPSPWDKKAVQMPHQLVLNYLSSNFIFNQTLYTPFRERYAVMTTSDFFKRPFWKSYSLTKAKLYLVNQSNPAKTEKTHGCITSEQEINPVQIPYPSNAMFKFPPRSQGTMHSQMPGVCPGGDVEVSNWSAQALPRCKNLWNSRMT